MTDEQKKNPAAIANVVVLSYALFAGLWILLSDRALGTLVKDPEALVRASMAKGWLFVAVTALLLYGLVRRLTGALVDAHRLALEHERAAPALVRGRAAAGLPVHDRPGA